MRYARRVAYFVIALATGAPTLVAQSQTGFTLDDAVRAGLQYYPGIQSARAAVAGAEASLKQTGASRLPSLGVTGSLVRFQEQMIVAPLHAFDPTQPPVFNRSLVQSEWSAAYTVFDGGKRSANIAAGHASLGASQSGKAATEQALIQRVAGTYLTILSAQQIDSAAGSRIAALEAEVLRAQRLLDLGRTARVQVLRAQAALAAARAEKVTTQSQVASLSNELGRLTGTAVAPASLEKAHLREDPYPVESVLTPDINNPSIMGASQEVERSQALLRAARATRMPSVSLQSGLVTFGSTSGDFSGEWRAGVGVSFPIFTGGARTAEIQKAEAGVWKAQQDLRLVELETRNALEQALISVRGFDARAAATEEAVAHQEEVVRIEQLALDAGAGVQTDYLKAEADLFSVRASLIDLRHRALIARVAAAAVAGELSAEWVNFYLESEE